MERLKQKAGSFSALFCYLLKGGQMEELSELLQAQKIALKKYNIDEINAINRKIYAIREQQKEQQRQEREQRRITQQQQKAEQHAMEKLEH